MKPMTLEIFQKYWDLVEPTALMTDTSISEFREEFIDPVGCKSTGMVKKDGK